jgi:hypothetical protein
VRVWRKKYGPSWGKLGPTQPGSHLRGIRGGLQANDGSRRKFVHIRASFQDGWPMSDSWEHGRLAGVILCVGWGPAWPRRCIGSSRPRRRGPGWILYSRPWMRLGRARNADCRPLVVSKRRSHPLAPSRRWPRPPVHLQAPPKVGVPAIEAAVPERCQDDGIVLGRAVLIGPEGGARPRRDAPARFKSRPPCVGGGFLLF